MPYRCHLILAVQLVWTGLTLLANPLQAEVVDQPPVPLPMLGPTESLMIPPGSGIDEQEAISQVATSNPMLWQQYQALQSGGYVEGNSESCQSCSGKGTSWSDRCGCNLELFPWIPGPGNCDSWCVGPKWEIDGGGLFMFREDANWNAVIAAAGAPQPVLVDQFEHGPGGRVSVAGYNELGYGLQVIYEGINDWDASIAYALGDFAANETRDFTYQSRLNSVEINFLRYRPAAWQLFSGLRYIQLDEDFLDSSVTDKPIPPPVVAPGNGTPFIDTAAHQLLENRLFGFQLGGRRDAWQWGNHITISTFANAGVYCNKLRREDVNLTTTTIITADDLATPDVNEFSQTSTSAQASVRRTFTEIAFVGEAGVAAAWRLNQCTAVRAGYQILALDGVSQGLDAFLFPNAGLNSSTLVFHGLQFGLEYRR